MRHWIVGILAGCVLLFALQNMNRIGVTLLFWTLNAHLSAVVIVTFLTGALSGISFVYVRRNLAGRRKTQNQNPENPTPDL